MNVRNDKISKKKFERIYFSQTLMLMESSSKASDEILKLDWTNIWEIWLGIIVTAMKIGIKIVFLFSLIQSIDFLADYEANRAFQQTFQSAVYNSG